LTVHPKYHQGKTLQYLQVGELGKPEMSARISHLGMFNFFSIPPQINTIKNWEYTSAFHILVCGRSSP
jgi:hypothetical protein